MCNHSHRRSSSISKSSLAGFEPKFQGFSRLPGSPLQGFRASIKNTRRFSNTDIQEPDSSTTKRKIFEWKFHILSFQAEPVAISYAVELLLKKGTYKLEILKATFRDQDGRAALTDSPYFEEYMSDSRNIED